MASVDELNGRFGAAGVVRFEVGQGGLTKAVVTTQGASAEVYLHGAHVTAYQREGVGPVLFVSSKSNYQADKPIRGGVPVIFPWFGPRKDDPAAPMHGFARVMEWEVEGVHDSVIVLRLDSSERTKVLWPGDFSLRYVVNVGGDALDMALEVRNTGAGEWKFEEALHTYFLVGDATKVTIDGLEGVTYLDKTEGMKRKVQANEPIALTAETDRLYLNTQAECVVHDPASHRRIVVGKAGSDSTVVWNPWGTRAKQLPDFGADEWRQMVCVETVNAADNSVTLGPGASHVMRQSVRAEMRQP